MKKIFWALLVFVTCHNYAQTTTLPSEYVKAFVSQESLFAEDILIQVMPSSNGIFEFKLLLNSTSKTFKIKPLSFEEFDNKLESALSELLSDNTITLKTQGDKESVKHLVSFVYGQLITELRVDNVKPLIAIVSLRKNIPVLGKENNNEEPRNFGELKDYQADFTFYDGFIEKIMLKGIINDEEVVFRNIYSIGISSVRNVKQLKNVVLYSMYKYNIKGEEDYYRVKLGDVINYEEIIDVNSNDISPATQLVRLSPDNDHANLYKDETTKLFEAQVYSDLLAMFDEGNPNGKIQTEIKKRFNLNTRRHDMWSKVKWAFPGYGIAQYFDVFFEFSKIEQSNKFLKPQNFIDDEVSSSIVSPFFTLISMHQHRIFAIGGNLNILTFENPNTKMNLTIDAGFLFGRSGIKHYGETTTVQELKDIENINYIERYLNNMEVPIEAKIVLLPEKRLNFTIANKLSWFDIFDDNVKLVSLDKTNTVPKNRWLNTVSVGMNLNLSQTGRLFVRYKMTSEFDNINMNYSRLQFGYSFYLLQQNNVKKATEKFAN
ncbi:hypothetical protein [Bizionia paragorgiae]|uniref:Outer membrane protein beta-barrel family protein n=1 Tax=Bizionia paragorgiae TaxID=283786 RepID=A0A1H3X1Z4_BIZPA|nr:hypothetical protein [Bizionia paragorgiae]SDZ93419.1 hypothetical protein SAMN04487990_104112 [Bizionia paragorgiae]